VGQLRALVDVNLLSSRQWKPFFFCKFCRKKVASNFSVILYVGNIIGVFMHAVEAYSKSSQKSL